MLFLRVIGFLSAFPRLFFSGASPVKLTAAGIDAHLECSFGVSIDLSS